MQLQFAIHLPDMNLTAANFTQFHIPGSVLNLTSEIVTKDSTSASDAYDEFKRYMVHNQIMLMALYYVTSIIFVLGCFYALRLMLFAYYNPRSDKERLTHVYLVDDGVVYKEAFHKRNTFKGLGQRIMEQRIMEQMRAEAEREAAVEEESDINSNDVGLKDNMHDNQD
ncbi:hypothetical protein CEXT_509471 [Caerostris extrusa]|uniref:Uncharacterized protein n=1 Tax=Caerostris extrusa TaxID=172846 RepID=A0AAV4YEE1_CAEEX|nr:hypothetical protein CEXT_509471 [Caerostris extrusa]